MELDDFAAEFDELAIEIEDLPTVELVDFDAVSDFAVVGLDDFAADDSDFDLLAAVACDLAALSLRTASAIGRVPDVDVVLRAAFFSVALAAVALALLALAAEPVLAAAALAAALEPMAPGALGAAGIASSAQSESMSSVAGGIDVVAASIAGSSPQPESRSSSEGSADFGGILALRLADASPMSTRVPPG